jgi:hypothetical protein
VQRTLSFGFRAKTAVSIFKNLEEAKRIDPYERIDDGL